MSTPTSSDLTEPVAPGEVCPHDTEPIAYGLIEWDRGRTPTLIVATSAAAVRRAAVQVIASSAADGDIAADGPELDLSVPDPDASDSVIETWLDALYGATTVPLFTLYDGENADDIMNLADPVAAEYHSVDGHPVTVQAENSGGQLRLQFVADGMPRCGGAELAGNVLRIELPDHWSPADKAAAACLLGRAAFQGTGRPAETTPTRVIITLGFTASDRAADYSSFSDGYRIGARQESVTIAVDLDRPAMTAEQWADAVYEATNLRDAAPAGPAHAVHLALADQVRGPLRSLSLGDTVTVHGQQLACEAEGWRRVDQPSTGDDR